jgi:hypothetical protein
VATRIQRHGLLYWTWTDREIEVVCILYTHLITGAGIAQSV